MEAEPTDFTIQPEHWCGEYHLNDQEMYLGLDKDTALDCFRFDLYGESAVEQGRKKPAIFYENGGLKVETLIGEADTPCFSMRRYLLEKGSFTLDQPASVWVCAAGEGVFLALPDKRQRFVHVLPGAAGAACAWVIYSEIYSWYVNHIVKASALYGSLSVLLLMLLWLYACISILFYGALLNHALFDWKKKKEKPECSDM